MKVLYLTYVWPEATSSAAGIRSWNLLRAFLSQGWSVTCASPSQFNAHAEALVQAGAQARSWQANDSEFDPWIQALAPDLVVFDRFVTEEQFGWRVKAQCPGALRVLDTQDLHFLRRARMRDVAKETGGEEPHPDLLRELSAIYRSDLTLVISDYELRLLKEELGVPSELVTLYRLGYPQPPEKRLPREERRGFAVIGNFRHPPNLDGVQWLHRELWPKIRALLPDATVTLYGAYPPQEVSALHDLSSGFLVGGWTPDARAALERHRVSLAPLRFGAGVKGKITDSWWAGTPVVTTPVGAEGMCQEREFPGLVAEEPDAFAQAAVQMMGDPELWQRTQESADAVMRALYQETENNTELGKTLIQAQRDLPQRRSRNLMGGMLWHHQYRSTEYFSRWIEQKNKK